jgi:protein-S-isoprenylcysteine O-methyltransferase Ste14
MPYPMQIIGYLIDACWLVFFVYWIANAFGNKKSIYKRQNPLLRIAVIILIVWAVSMISSSYQNMQIFPFTKAGQILGVALCALGIAYAVWARKILADNWSAWSTIKENQELVQNGPYAITRHPIYTGVIFAILGTFLAIVPTWLYLGFFILCIIAFSFRIKKEERLMTQTFPQDYPAYKQRVRWALIPYIF